MNSQFLRLPADSYWPDLDPGVEYRQLQHDRPPRSTTSPKMLPLSGVHRGQQRAIYDARRDELIPAHGLRLVIIKPCHLDATSRGRLRRNSDHDIKAVAQLLRPVADAGALPGWFEPRQPQLGS